MNLDLGYWLDRETEYGWRVRDIELFNGHHLVVKVPTGDGVGVILPDSYKKKSVKNIVMIRGFVVAASKPFRRKSSRKTYVWDQKSEQLVHKWVVYESDVTIPSDVHAGDGILYMSYNVGRVKVKGVTEPLVVVREIDIVSSFGPEHMDRIGLPKKSYTCVPTH